MEGWQKKGGQADYVRELSTALTEAGNRVIVVNPYFQQPHADISQEPGEYLFDISIPLGKGMLDFGVYSNCVSGVRYLRFRDKTDLLYPIVYPQTQHDVLSLRGTAEKEPYTDSLYSYVEAILLSWAGMLIVEKLGLKVSNFHFNDWQAGLGAAYIKLIYRKTGRLNRLLGQAGTVITIHNLAYQGIFAGVLSLQKTDPLIRLFTEKAIIDDTQIRRYRSSVQVNAYSLTNLPLDLLGQTHGGMEYYSNFVPGQHNFMKCGIEFADLIVAVSEGNMQEIKTEDQGFGLGGVITRRAEKEALTYVYNGVNLDAFNPYKMVDLTEIVDENRNIAFNQYSSNDPFLMDKLRNNRRAVYEKLNAWKGIGHTVATNKMFGVLDKNGIARDLFVVGVSRLVKQKGYQLLFEPLDDDSVHGIHRGDRLLELALRLRGPSGEKIQFIVMGTPGDEEGYIIARMLRQAAKKHQKSGQLLFVEAFEPKLANQIRSVGGIFWTPSLYEPGGIANQEAAKLGLLSFETLTGGLKDFVDKKGTSRLFTAPPFKDGIHSTLETTAVAFYEDFKKALHLWCMHPHLWEVATREVMKFQWDWRQCVPHYEKVYKHAQDNISIQD